MGSGPKRYPVTGGPEGLGEPGEGSERMATALEIAQASGVPLKTIQCRLGERRWKDWARLSQSPEAARRAQVAAGKRLLGGYQDASRQMDPRRARTSAVAKGHKPL